LWWQQCEHEFNSGNSPRSSASTITPIKSVCAQLRQRLAALPQPTNQDPASPEAISYADNEISPAYLANQARQLTSSVNVTIRRAGLGVRVGS
jgi:hypothetical protein